MLPFLSAVPLSAFPCLTLTSGEYLIVPLKNRSVTRILQLQFFEPSENGVHDLPVVTHSSHYMKCHLKCLVMQIITSDDLVIPLNFKSMDCSLSMSTVWVFYVFNSVISKVWHVMFWYTGLLLVSKRKCHTVLGGFFFFFHCNVGSVMAMPKICWCNFCCQCFESGRGKTQNKNICHRI